MPYRNKCEVYSSIRSTRVLLTGNYVLKFTNLLKRCMLECRNDAYESCANLIMSFTWHVRAVRTEIEPFAYYFSWNAFNETFFNRMLILSTLIGKRRGILQITQNKMLGQIQFLIIYVSFSALCCCKSIRKPSSNSR